MGSDFNIEKKPQTCPLLKIKTFRCHFTTDASLFNDWRGSFFNKFSVENYRAGHFSMGSLYNVTLVEDENIVELFHCLGYVDEGLFYCTYSPYIHTDKS